MKYIPTRICIGPIQLHSAVVIFDCSKSQLKEKHNDLFDF